MNGEVKVPTAANVESLIALASYCVLGQGKGLPPFPAPLSPLAALFLRFASDRFSLTKPNCPYKKSESA